MSPTILERDYKVIQAKGGAKIRIESRLTPARFAKNEKNGLGMTSLNYLSIFANLAGDHSVIEYNQMELPYYFEILPSELEAVENLYLGIMAEIALAEKEERRRALGLGTWGVIN